MKTHYAPPERKQGSPLHEDLETITSSPVIDTLLETVSGLLAVLNEERQILAVNESLLEMLGLGDAKTLLGLRPGEALQCIHAHEMPAGCGTGTYCSTCGAAIAMVSTLATEEPAERDCVVTIKKNNLDKDLHLKVRAAPFSYQDQRFVLLFLQNMTDHHRRAALERIFFHDLNNIIWGLSGATECLDQVDKGEVPSLIHQIKKLVLRLQKEVEIQKVLSCRESCEYTLARQEVSLGQVLNEVRAIFQSHPCARGKSLVFPEENLDHHFRTDLSLLLRILTNMVTNGLEATEAGGVVKFWVETGEQALRFRVWNWVPIPVDVSKRIFQRHFSTKNEAGRGFGTYCMKLFGEQYLGGTMDFSSSESEGTVFTFTLFL